MHGVVCITVYYVSSKEKGKGRGVGGGGGEGREKIGKTMCL